MKEQLLQLFQYDYWANSLILDTLIEHEVTNEKSTFLISHLVNAEQIWWDRIQNRIPRVTVQDVHELAVSQRMLTQVNRDILTWLEYARDNMLEEHVSYRNSKGHTFENAIQDILTHVINHSTHHRAQIALKLREMDIDPPGTDYIFYLRSK